MKKILMVLIFFITVIFLNAQNNNTITVQKNNTKTQKSTTFPIKTQLKKADISKVILDNISKDYGDYKYEKAYKVEAHKVITYEVHVKKDESILVLVYNKDGKFIKKEPVMKTEKKNEVKKVEDNKAPLQQTK